MKDLRNFDRSVEANNATAALARKRAAEKQK